MENKYEAKEAWAVYKYNLCVIKGVLFSKNNKPMRFFKSDSEVCYTMEEVEFFYTEKEAKAYSNEKKSEYKELAKQTLNNIMTLDNISSDIVQQKDYLSEEHCLKDSPWYDRYYELRSVMNTGIININAVSFRKKDVAHIEWGDDCAKVCLKDGSDVKTYGKLEFNLINDIFGMNNSGRTYTALKDEKEEEDEADD